MKMQFKNSVVRSGIFIMAAISLAACGNTNKSKENKVENENMTADVGQVETPAETSDISFKDEDGKTVSLSSLKGKVVYSSTFGQRGVLPVFTKCHPLTN
ncbi:hypothetical protein [Sinomicrobium sp.]